MLAMVFQLVLEMRMYKTRNGLRPVINLSSEVIVLSGDGSATNPYRVIAE